MLKRFRQLALISAIGLIVTSVYSCNNNSELSDHEYFEEAIELMKEHSIHSRNLDWNQIRLEVEEHLTQHDRKSTAMLLLELIKTNHTAFRTKDGKLFAFHSELHCEFDGEQVQDIPNDIGYLKIDGNTKKNRAQRKQEVQGIHNLISEKDSESLKGWIIDLRYNTGGSVYSMIAALGPLLGNKKIGHFINPNLDLDDKKRIIGYGYKNGSALAIYKRFTVEQPYLLKYPDKPIIVLTSNITSSSGEAIAIGFKKHPNVLFIGENTCGMATANKRFKMSDGSFLVLTTSYMADREMATYESGLSPDISIDATSALSFAIQHLYQSVGIDSTYSNENSDNS